MEARIAWQFLILVVVVLSLETLSVESVYSLARVSDIFSLSLPARVQLEGSVKSPHFSGTALVFDLENEGRVTCYHRHPSPHFPLISNDVVRVIARIEQTPRGRLCVVEEVGS